MATARAVLILVLLFAAVPAAAQSIDWKPTIALAAAEVLDTTSTYRFIHNGSGCTERNAMFWGYGKFTADAPDFRKMWAYDGFAIGGHLLIETMATRLERNHPTKFSSSLKWISKGLGYGGAARRMRAAVRNVGHCGW